MLKSILPTTLLLAGLAPIAASAAPLPVIAQAQTHAQTQEQTNPNIIEVYGGCGVYAHRGPYGGCRPGGQAGGHVRGYGCPAGFHVGPYGRHCWPN